VLQAPKCWLLPIAELQAWHQSVDSYDVWLAIGTVFYLVARWEGRRSGFDYEELLTRDLIEN
jgi:hypothetical protein